jgi:hypothetical protein
MLATLFRLTKPLVSAALLAFELCILIVFAFAWVFAMLGLFVGNAQAASGLSFLVLPLVLLQAHLFL